MTRISSEKMKAAIVYVQHQSQVPVTPSNLLKELESGQVKPKRKPSPKPQACTAHEHRKKVRRSAGDGLHQLAVSVESAMETLAGSLENSGRMSPKSSRQQEAIAAVEEDGELSPDEFNNAVILLTAQPSVATSYLAIKNQTARKRFLVSQVALHILHSSE
jgi:hypothetical protein